MIGSIYGCESSKKSLWYLQAQCKTFLDALHSHSLTQLTGSLLLRLAHADIVFPKLHRFFRIIRSVQLAAGSNVF